MRQTRLAEDEDSQGRRRATQIIYKVMTFRCETIRLEMFAVTENFFPVNRLVN